jgi:hypothetical protein
MDKIDFERILNNVASPRDYTSSKYLVYFELAITNDSIKKIITNHSNVLKEFEFGYLCEIHIQSVPELVRSLSKNNHAVYQVVRLVKLSN